MRTKPKIEIDLTDVERLAGLGLSQAEICLSLGIAESTLYARKKESGEFGAAIKRGRAKAAGVISNVLFDKAKDGDLGSIIWWEKTRRGLSDKVQVGGDPTQPLTIRIAPFDYDAAVAEITAGSDEDRPPSGAD